jgi:hypothetical protein
LRLKEAVMKWILFVPVAALFFLTGCGPAAEERGAAPELKGVQQETYQRSNPRDEYPGTRIRPQPSAAKRAEFLNRIRSADPQYATIQKALLNEQNELGVILNRQVDLNAIPALMRSLLTQMAKEFPGEDLTVIAYAPSDPPMKIGTGRLNARTRELTYTPAR